ncbi:MAG: hypothetical protein CSA95_00595 [Bacteroidetes bacterium]|nr:MAG: hypothetical protein CSA95_00595 [Bacteroidota bacterium]
MMRTPLFMIFLLLVSAVGAQSLLDTTYTLPAADVYSKRIFLPEEAGMKVSHIDTLLVMEKITQDLSELLSENTPIFIKSYGRGALATASFRGTAPSHTQVYWNGMNINSPMLGMVDFSLIPLYILDEVSLHHGTSSMAEGSGGLGGAITLDNKPQWEPGLDLRLLQGVGSYHTLEDFVALRVGSERFQSKTRAYFSSSRNDYTFLNIYNFDRDPQTGDFIYPVDTNKNADYRKWGVLQEFYLRTRSQARWSLIYWAQDSRRKIPGVASYEGPETSRLNKLSERSHRLILNRVHSTAQGAFNVQMGFQAHTMHYYLKNFIPGYGYRNAVFSQSKDLSLLNKAEYRRKMGKGWSLNSTLSWDYFKVSTKDTVTSEGYGNSRHDLSLLCTLQKDFGDRVHTLLMLRQGIVDGHWTPFSPYWGIDVMLSRKYALVLKGNVARNFHQPTLNDLYWLPGGNPELRPEQGISGELGVAHLWEQDRVKLASEVTAFYSDVKDWIIWTYSGKGYWNPLNIKHVVSKGVEVSANVAFQFKKIRVQSVATYAFTRALNYGDRRVWGDDSYGKQLVYVPVHSGNVMFRVEWKKWSLVWQHNSYSERFTTSSNDLHKRSVIYPYFMNDLKVAKSFDFKGFRITSELKVFNLFDESYHSVLIQPMPGINAMFSLLFDLK